MEQQVKKLEKGQAEIKITVPALEMTPFVELAVSQISQAVKFEGFRPGKATYEVIKQKLGEPEIWQQAAENAIAKTYALAVKEIALKDEKFLVVDRPTIKIEKLTPNEDLIFTATVALLPEVKLGDYQKLKVKRQEVTIAKDKAEKILTDLQKARGKEKLVLRPAQVGDKVVVDFDLMQNKVLVEHGSEKNYPIHLGEGKFLPQFEENILGLTAGQVKEFTVKFPENYWQKILAGKDGDFKVTIKDVFEIELPKLDDEFAKSFGQFDSLADLTKKIGENLLAEAKDKEEQRLEQESLEALIKQASFSEIPEALLNNETHKMVHEITDNLTQQGLNFADYLKHLKKSEKEFELELSPQALQRVKTVLVLRALQTALKIEITPDEINKEVEEAKRAYANNPELLKHLETEEYRGYLAGILGNRQVVKWLKDNLIQ
ncbi:MAG: trigger factor [Candidatus Buchananbacteria bacterium]